MGDRGIFCQEYRCFPGNRSKQSSAAPDFETCRAHCDFFFYSKIKNTGKYLNGMIEQYGRIPGKPGRLPGMDVKHV